MNKLRYYIFLRDIFWLSLTAFGGPQAHMAMYFDVLVNKRNYLTEEQLIELNALCQILPGPTSTQTLTAIGYQRGGALLAFLTLFVWMFPAVLLMITAAYLLSYLETEQAISMDFTRFIQPMAVGFVAYAALKISKKVVRTRTSFVLMCLAAVIAYYYRYPWVFPLLLVVGGVITALKFEQQEREQKDKFKVSWRYLLLYGGVFIGVAILGGLTQSLPIRLFENFYRNGSLIFGGGQVLVPVLYTEFVEFKRYLSSEEFLSGYALVQAVPGPVFSFAGFVGALSLRDWGIWGFLGGGFLAAFAVFLPGTLLIFFVIKFWDSLKRYRPIKASLEGINGTSSGLVIAAAFLLLQPIDFIPLNFAIIVITFVGLTWTRIPAPFFILGGLISGFVF
ncbi:MAG: chromate efflux transporter [Bernardetiaceae bacterium]|nr:chromate efflux transporter [Bernardetiaceae bacterium]